MENQINNHIELKPVNDLLGMSFFIPGYQRGYRWKTRQVLDLLEDLQDFFKNNKEGGHYCLQPLVVRKLDDNSWEVIDGQQRLTTVFILLNYLKEKCKSNNCDARNSYNLSYATRLKSEYFLKNITPDEAQDNIDFRHIYNTRQVIVNWFSDNVEGDVEVFLKKLLNNTEFIWYESEEKDPIEVFTRLNIGKISLTNAELVKALLLNSSNFDKNDDNVQSKFPTQNEVAIIWDQIEYTLQNDRFWCFIHEDGFTQPTRIDFLLEIIKIMRNKPDSPWYVKEKDLGNDDYQTFRYFYQLVVKQAELPYLDVWHEIVKVFNIVKEWYYDNECYHYIGFLSCFKVDVPCLFNTWEKERTKQGFESELKKLIKHELPKKSRKLSQQYEIEDCGKVTHKTICKQLLLLFNVQTVVNKNNLFKQDGKFNALSFERFPFDLYKKEKGWDIEHIAANTDNAMDSAKLRAEWLENVIIGKPELTEEIKNYIDQKGRSEEKSEPDTDFTDLLEIIEKDSLDDKNKNKVWNFCLLDLSTNRGYGNSIFATKRKWILNREKGLDVNGQSLGNKEQVFIPPCTLRVFTKYYTQKATDLSVWNQDDARDYQTVLYETLKEFDVTY